jgi:chromosomal replication initiator protein
MSHPPEFWDGVLRRLGTEMPAFALEAWVRPLVVEADGEEVRLLCPSAFHRERVRERHLEAIVRCVDAEVGRPLRVELGLAPLEARAAMPHPSAPRRSASSAQPLEASRARPKPAQRGLPYRFDTFVVGPCNALAREAALAVAHDRQQRLNPLYLTSQTGLGKTHLARAIVDEARRRDRGPVLYASAESFTNEFMAAIRSRRMDGFKRRYRESSNLVVIEDVQFLTAKTATQLELFHTLAHLLDAGARIVITGDRLPREVQRMDPRLGSQMTAGLVAELEAPDAAMRREILRAKAAHGGVHLPDDCLDLLATSASESVRDLDGVLIQLVACASLLKRPIDLQLTRTALRKIAPAPSEVPQLDVRSVIEVVALYYRTRPETLASRSRRRDVLVPRQLAMYLCRRYTDEPVSAIATALGRDHPAVSNAVKVVERRILEHAPLRYQVEALCQRLDEEVRNRRRR